MHTWFELPIVHFLYLLKNQVFFVLSFWNTTISCKINHFFEVWKATSKIVIFKDKQIRPRQCLKYFSNSINLKIILNVIKYYFNTFTQMLYKATILPIVIIKHYITVTSSNMMWLNMRMMLWSWGQYSITTQQYI